MACIATKPAARTRGKTKSGNVIGAVGISNLNIVVKHVAVIIVMRRTTVCPYRTMITIDHTGRRPGSSPGNGLMNIQQTRERLDELDRLYPNTFRMPPDIRNEYDNLSIDLIADVWQRRIKKTGTIHSYLYRGEKPGAG